MMNAVADVGDCVELSFSGGRSAANFLGGNGPSRSNNLLGIISHHPYNEDIM